MVWSKLDVGSEFIFSMKAFEVEIKQEQFESYLEVIDELSDESMSRRDPLLSAEPLIS